MSSPKFRDLSIASKSLILIEFFLFLGALPFVTYGSSFIMESQFSAIPDNYLLIYSVVFALLNQLTSLALGLYNSKLRVNFRGVIRRVLMCVAVAFFILTIINPLYGTYALPIEVLAIASLVSFILISFFRYLTVQIDFFGFNKRIVLVLGAGERASIIERRMRRDVDRQSFSVHGYIVMNGDAEEGIKQETRIELKGSLVNYALNNQIDEIVVASDERRNNIPIDELFACKIRGIEITEILDFIERETGQIAVNLIYPSWVIYSNGFASANHLRNTLDWIFNAAMASILLFVTWPIMLLTAVLIKLDEGLKAPVFYFQERVGLDGEPFNIIKFRSMRLDAEKFGAQMASEDDPRITKIGNILRKYRIDELPQIYNVIRGDMGFVGPRPERPEFVQSLIKNIPYYNERHNVKPGLTGWAQLKYPYGATEADSLEKLKYDLYYIKHRSFMLDLLILIRTVEIVLFGKGR
ncbi:TIGR03013 family PEP-CTERM/XrtA system glycosyltransferase [Colwellia sp. 4_MG-2023]|uniref:TIGR03013 family XrtA/PEP-CTERM system glycosyltransferase n=1 Tax=unclassified Colwellia TaxID=196834 RepID=UPI0026E140F1|nr:MULTISPECIES: TIGR03013 family XrtA/PEP-CTERM system glycosyltransferase [unclassified Colwellia]MDO6506847.1 TIGR03013 family PEP-CTERM/XrtA system glycosyltransferase [Colwellia sp. 5_MG-2023]MDO6555778.1 TIGR03013 family PEP-CTERM/XrtA system glycosyltransferase [Colwellia sp. 4_MG-2023]